MARKTVIAKTTPSAEFAAAVRAASDAMRRDAGLNGDVDRIRQLAWLLFLKAFDSLGAEPRDQRRRLPTGHRCTVPLA